MTDARDSRLLHRVVVQNYKSIASCDVALGPLTFLVGPNGSGKSNFLDALRFVSESLSTSLDHAVRVRGGFAELRHLFSAPGPFGFRLEFRLPSGAHGYYAFSVSETAEGFTVDQEECSLEAEGGEGETQFYRIRSGTVERSTLELEPAVLPDRLYLVALSGTPAFRPVFDALSSMAVYSFEPSLLREPQVGTPGILERNGVNLPRVITHLAAADPGLKSRLEEYLGQVVPGVTGVEAVPVGRRETIEFTQQGTPFLAASMSDGTLRALAVLTAIFQGGAGGEAVPLLVGLEEPETALHPFAAQVLVDGLREAAEFRQVVVTSHSPDLLTGGEVAEREILAVSAQNGETRIGPMESAGREVMELGYFSAGELLRMNQILPGAPSAHGTDVLFGAQMAPCD